MTRHLIRRRAASISVLQRLGTGVGIAALCAAMATTGAAFGSASAGAATQATTVLKLDVLPGLPLLMPSQPSPSTVLHIGIGLSEPNGAAENAYVASLYNPRRPDYHHFLTPMQFDAAFGVPRATVEAVQRWLIGGHLQVTETAGAGNWIQASGTVARIDSLMHVAIFRYTSKGVSFLANAGGPRVPAGDSIESVVGLNTLQRFSIPKTITGLPTGSSPGLGCNPSCYYTPQQLWSMYDLPSSDQGQGMTMGVFGEGRSSDVIANLRDFEKTMKLPQIPVTVRDVGKGPFSDDSGQIEWDLDTQASTGMAPEVKSETLYFASSLLDADVETELAAWVSDKNGPLQMNASFGECETNPANQLWNAEPPAVGQFVGDGDNLEPIAEKTLEQATIEGRTLFAAAGDTGSSCPFAALPVIGAGNGIVNQGQPMLNYPCASDYAVCVGGTVLYSNGATKHPQRDLEYSWPYTGGGSSGFIAEPPWQKKVSAIDHPCLVSPSGTQYPSGTICRGAPDVAAMSGDILTNGYDIYANGAATTEGGTSLSSPLWMGMWTRVQSAAKSPLGFANPLLYAVGNNPSEYAKDFYDITIGTNGLYQAGTGWDYTSGWGVPVVANLMKTLDGKLTPTKDVGPGPVKAPKPPACPLLWANPPHTATDVLGNSDPQLSLLNGAMFADKKTNTLRVELTVTNLSETVPTGATAEDWYMTWKYGKTMYFAQAQLGTLPGSAPTFDDGTIVLTGTSHQYSEAHTDSGAFKPGKDGSITINVPFANVGGISWNQVLGSPAGATFTEEGIPPNPSGQSAASLQAVDSGGPTNSYTVGSTCRSKS
ncbi:MAG: S53 family serine peptidase [Actinomycetota bacterium]|nr:S53 family serine peptidase [Actinomycetota bacterium]